MSERQPLELPSHEVLSQLAQDDPQAYETLRREVIEGFIDSAPEGIKFRLRGIQFRVDSVRRLSRSTLGSTLRVYTLMWESFLRLNDGWQDLLRMTNGGKTASGHAPAADFVPKAGARVIEFRPRPQPASASR